MKFSGFLTTQTNNGINHYWGYNVPLEQAEAVEIELDELLLFNGDAHQGDLDEVSNMIAWMIKNGVEVVKLPH
tara:strand:+ start:312 stop:530 length:219 start_codon:yes stop_codon:yes gene_type:complete